MSLLIIIRNKKYYNIIFFYKSIYIKYNDCYNNILNSKIEKII